MRTRLIGYRTKCDREHAGPSCADVKCYRRQEFLRDYADRIMMSALFDAISPEMMAALYAPITPEARRVFTSLAEKMKAEVVIASIGDVWQDIPSIIAGERYEYVPCHNCLNSFAVLEHSTERKCPRCGAV